MRSRLSILIISATILSGCSSLPFLSPKPAALQVMSEPQANIFLNDNYVGQSTFYDDNLKPGEYTIKLQKSDQPEQEWQAKIGLYPSVVTVVNRSFAPTDVESSHYIVEMQQIGENEAAKIALVTIPDNVIVKLDGQPEGFTPITLNNIAEGSHTISIVAPGYREESINIQATRGYQILITASLGKTEALIAPPTPTPGPTASPSATPIVTPAAQQVTPSATSSASASPTPPYVTILETGTGWLRVRSAPSGLTQNEVAKIDVGDTYPFIESSEDGWYKIEYAPGEAGWISAKFADLTE